MAEYSVGDALRILIERAGWGSKVNELRMRQEWEAIVGATIAKYTTNIHLNGRVLTIQSDVAPLKHELMLGKENLVKRINEYFKQTVVLDIVVR
jgi:predicted nucleic acid-binding Zn ribbon protein